MRSSSLLAAFAAASLASSAVYADDVDKLGAKVIELDTRVSTWIAT